MTDVQLLLETVKSLPEGASWGDITDALLALAYRRGATPKALAELYRSRLTLEQLAEYLNPQLDHSLSDVIAELETRRVPGAE